MATVQIEQIILQVKQDNTEALSKMAKLQQAIDSVKNTNSELNKSIKTQEKELKNLAKTVGEDSAEYQTLNKELTANRNSLEQSKVYLAELNTQYSQNSQQLKANIQLQNENEGSLRAMQAQLKVLNKEYENMSAYERKNTEEGKALGNQIKALSDAYKEEQMSIGNTYVNVGNYQDAIEKAMVSNNQFLGQFVNMQKQAAATGQSLGTVLVNNIKAVGTAMKALAANPLMLILAGLALLIKSIISVVKSSEEQTNRVNKLLAPMKALLDGVMNVLQAIVGWILKGVEVYASFLGGIMKIAENIPFIGDAIKEVNKGMEEAVQLEQDQQDLIIKRRNELEEIALAERNIADYKLKAQERDKYSNEERINFLKEAIRLEQSIADKNVENLKEELRIQTALADRSQNNAETNQRLAELRAEVIRAETSALNKQKELTAQLQGLQQTMAADAKKAADEQKKRVEDYIAKVKEGATQIHNLQISLMDEGYKKQRTILDAQLKSDLASVKGNAEQQAEAKLLIQQKYEKDLIALRQQFDVDAYNKAVERITEENNIRLRLNKNNSTETTKIRLDQLDIEYRAAVERAKKTGVDLHLIDLDFENQRRQIIEEQSQLRIKQFQDEYAKINEERARQYEIEMLTLQDNEEARNALTLEFEQQRLTAILEMDTAQKEALGLNEVAYTNLVIQQQNKVGLAIKAQQQLQQQQLQQQLSSITALGNSIKDVFSSIAEDDSQFAEFSYALALFQIGVDTATAIAGATASATPGDPYTVAIRIAAAVAAAVAAMASATTALKKAKAPDAPKFATGGLIEGAGTGTSDSINIRASNGESIMTAKATNMFAPLLSGINQIGGGVPIYVRDVTQQIDGEDAMVRIFAKALQYMPNPIVSVEEITKAQDRVEVIESLVA